MRAPSPNPKPDLFFAYKPRISDLGRDGEGLYAEYMKIRKAINHSLSVKRDIDMKVFLSSTYLDLIEHRKAANKRVNGKID